MKFNNFSEASAFLLEQLPMFSRMGKDAFKPSLDNIRALCLISDAPQNKLKCIHVAGTNGKGSVSHIISAALINNGYSVGLYTSPHLIDLTERIRVNGVQADQQFIVNYLNKYYNDIIVIQPSYFELNVAMAFYYFAQKQVDYAVIETGLGGRLDSTNIINPILSVITNISLDHTDILGNTLPKIAQEKAGIIKYGIPVVIGEQHPDTDKVFITKANQENSQLYYANDFFEVIKSGFVVNKRIYKIVDLQQKAIHNMETDLIGEYQNNNIRTSLAAIKILMSLNIELEWSKVLSSLSQIKSLTGLKGRWDIISEHPLIILDVAHNPAGIYYLSKNLSNYTQKPIIIIGFVKDKDVTATLQGLPKHALFVFTEAKIPRALAANDLKIKAKDQGIEGIAIPDIAAALTYALNEVNEEHLILITGSFFVVGEALQVLQKIEI